MEYLKVWVSFRQVMEPLSDDEKGRLFEMMLRYAESGEEPEQFSGNERFLWQVAKQDIDRTAARAETLKANGSKGGRPRTKTNQEEPTESNKNQEEANESLNIKKSNIKKSNVKKNNNDLFERFWETYPRHENKQAAIKAFNKLGITEEMLMMLLSSIERQKESAQWKENGGQFIPHPATWLNGHRWEDEITQATGKTVTAQGYSQRDYTEESEDAFKRMIEQMEGHGA